MTIDELKREALSLDPPSRANLARELLSSLNDLPEEEIERLWIEEALRWPRPLFGKARIAIASASGNRGKPMGREGRMWVGGSR